MKYLVKTNLLSSEEGKNLYEAKNSLREAIRDAVEYGVKENAEKQVLLSKISTIADLASYAEDTKTAKIIVDALIKTFHL